MDVDIVLSAVSSSDEVAGSQTGVSIHESRKRSAPDDGFSSQSGSLTMLSRCRARCL
jgi:hypothetical protein